MHCCHKPLVLNTRSVLHTSSKNVLVLVGLNTVIENVDRELSLLLMSVAVHFVLPCKQKANVRQVHLMMNTPGYATH